MVIPVLSVMKLNKIQITTSDIHTENMEVKERENLVKKSESYSRMKICDSTQKAVVKYLSDAKQWTTHTHMPEEERFRQTI